MTSSSSSNVRPTKPQIQFPEHAELYEYCSQYLRTDPSSTILYCNPRALSQLMAYFRSHLAESMMDEIDIDSERLPQVLRYLREVAGGIEDPNMSNHLLAAASFIESRGSRPGPFHVEVSFPLEKLEALFTHFRMMKGLGRLIASDAMVQDFDRYMRVHLCDVAMAVAEGGSVSPNDILPSLLAFTHGTFDAESQDYIAKCALYITRIPNPQHGAGFGEFLFSNLTPVNSTKH